MNQQTLSNLREIRRRLHKTAILMLGCFVFLMYFSSDVYDLLAEPLIKVLPLDAHMIATSVTTPFFIPIKLTWYFVLLLCMPFAIYQVWAFIAQGLYKEERIKVAPLMILSTLLFYCGVIFVYYIVFPIIFGFFTHVGPKDVLISTDIANYFDFAITMFMAFGLSFQIPIIVCVICGLGLVDSQVLRKKRGYVFVSAFFIAMVLTPPDMLSQTLLAVPICMLFEFGLLLSRILLKDGK